MFDPRSAADTRSKVPDRPRTTPAERLPSPDKTSDLEAAGFLTKPKQPSTSHGHWACHQSWCGEGWYVELQHADHSVTRYCHMMLRPLADVGQSVAVGQVVGLVGSGGHSSGSHLHLESHLGSPASNANAVNPVDFFRDRLVDVTKP